MTGTVVRRLETTEAFQIEDVLVDGIAEIQYIDDQVRVLFYVDYGTEHRGRVRLVFTRAYWDQMGIDFRAGRCSGDVSLAH